MRKPVHSSHKKKKGVLAWFFLNLILSLFILHILAILLWISKGFKTTCYFFSKLYVANQKAIISLPKTNWFQSIEESFSFSIQPILEKAQNLGEAGGDLLKNTLSEFINPEFVDKGFLQVESFLDKSYIFLSKVFILFLLILKVFLIKTFLVIAALPLFILLGVVGLIDGLSQREIRRAELGRESSYLFHFLNKNITKIIILGLFVWLCFPIALNPQWFFIPLALLFAGMLSFSTSKFKKYL